MDFLKDLGTLGPALGSVVVIGLLCWKLLQLFDKMTTSMNENTRAMDKLSCNVEKNTQATEATSSIIKEALYEQLPRKSSAYNHSR